MSADVPATDKPLSPDKNLPPVQPPTFGFLIQLFVVPGVIVAAIVAVWMLFNWLAHMGSDPTQELETIQRGSKSRWLAAQNLAQQLHEDRLQEDRNRSGKYCKDPEFCKKLAAALQQALDRDAYKNEEELQLRYYLTCAMGFIVIDEGTDVLFKAAETQRDECEIPVQIVALASLTKIATTLAERSTPGTEPWSKRAKLRELLLQFSKTPGDYNENGIEFRKYTAGLLGRFNEPEVIQQLEKMLNDFVMDVRFNAANSLAYQGQGSALPIIQEMLEVTSDSLLPGVQARIRKQRIEEQKHAQSVAANEQSRTASRDANKLTEQELQKLTENEKKMAGAERSLIIENALRSAKHLKSKAPQVDLSALYPIIEKLTTDENKPLANFAATSLQELQSPK
jgi:HEAT repeat protein